MIDVVRGTEKPEFFAGERQEQNAARGSRMRTEVSCEREKPRSARGIVIGARVNRTGLLRSERVLFPKPR